MKNPYFSRVLEKSGLSLSDQLPRNDGVTTTVGEALMAPTVIYVKQVGLKVLASVMTSYLISLSNF